MFSKQTYPTIKLKKKKKTSESTMILVLPSTPCTVDQKRKKKKKGSSHAQNACDNAGIYIRGFPFLYLTFM